MVGLRRRRRRGKFPDAIERWAVKHLKELEAAGRMGTRSCRLFVVQMKEYVILHQTDGLVKEFADKFLQKQRKNGVQVIAKGLFCDGGFHW